MTALPTTTTKMRVFTWNLRKHRYETAYREHGLDGVLPVTVTEETFDKEGTLPVFILRVAARRRQRQRAQVQAEYAHRPSGVGTGGSGGKASPEAALKLNPLTQYHIAWLSPYHF